MPDQNEGMGLEGAIRAIREQADLSQERLAEELVRRRGGTTKQATISKWENPKEDGSPSPADLALIEDICKRTRGTVYRMLGYVEDATTTREAIIADPRLRPDLVQLVVGAYDNVVEISAVKMAVTTRKTSRK